MVAEKLVTTGTRFTSIENILDDKKFKELVAYCRRQPFKGLVREDNTVMYFKELPESINSILNKIASDVWGKPLHDIYSFIRLNSSVHDTVFRVHSDSKVVDQHPQVAALFYLEDSETSGTAFFEHPLHGHIAKDSGYYVFTEEDEAWEIKDKYYAKANSMIVYDSRLFHGRFPWISYGKNEKDGRIVIVKFMREIDE
jgi:hypothetical protein